MTAKLLVLYRTPADVAAFDAYYRGTHVPIAKKIPGLRRYEISAAPPVGLGATAPYYLVATLEFDSIDALKAGVRSPQGEVAAGDMANFASAGAELLMFETEDA